MNSGENYHIILVEDSLSQAVRMRHLLESAGWRVTWVSNAEDAFAKLVEVEPDLVLLDHYLPGMRGDEVCRRIRRNIHSRNLPVVMLTAEESNAAELRGLDSGADDFIPKSADPDVLLLRLRTLMSKLHREREILPASDRSFRSARLLAIDDSPSYLERLRPDLESEGYEVETCLDPQKGLEKLRAGRFDGVLIDLVMPGLDGFEVCKRIDALRKHMDAPLVTVILTSSENREAYSNALQAGADDFVVKSPDTSVLKGRIRALLRRKFFEEENRRIADELRQKEMETIQARIEKEAAQARARLVEELERTADDLRRSQAELEQANQAKDQFLAILSHELRTPLTPVLATIGIWQNDPRLPKELLKDLSMLRRNVELEARLIDDLLDLTKITRNKLELRPTVIDMRDIVTHAIDICRDPTGAGPAIRSEFTATSAVVWGDGSRLTQILWNLLRNAIKFTPPDGQITIRAFNPPAKEDRIVIEVIDTGIGIDPDVLPVIFDAFEQGGRMVTREFGGLGLGLAISKAIAELHHGKITARSEGLRQGSTFALDLPVHAAAPSKEGRGDSSPKTASPPSAPASARILLVDDHEDTLSSLERLLTRRGHAITTASNVAEARSCLTSGEHFDLVVSDLGLPDGSGFDILSGVPAETRPPGIALSGYGSDADVQTSRQAGFTEHLTKPVDMAELERAIAQILSKRRRG